MPTWVCAPKSSGLSRAVSPRWDSCAASGGQSQVASVYQSLVVALVFSRLYYGNITLIGIPAYQPIVCSRRWTLQPDRSLAYGALTISLTRWPVFTGCVLLSDDGVSVTALSRPTVLRRPSSLDGYPVAATSAVRIFAAARHAADSLSDWLSDTSSHAFEVQIDTSSHGGRGAVAVGVFSSAWGGSFNFYRLVYFTAYCTRHRLSRLGYNLRICLCMWVSVRGFKKTSRRQIVTILALRYTRVSRFHHRRRPSRSMGRKCLNRENNSVGRSVCTPSDCWRLSVRCCWYDALEQSATWHYWLCVTDVILLETENFFVFYIISMTTFLVVLEVFT